MFACRFSASVCRIGVAVSLAPPSELPLGRKGGSWTGFPLASLPRALAWRGGARIAGGRRLWRMKQGGKRGKGEDEKDWSKLGVQTDSLRVSVPID